MPVFSSRELIERLRTKLPLAMELADPVTGQPFTVNRDNMLTLLVIDVDNLVLESQTAAMLFGEMARVHAAVKLAHEDADVRFRAWKAGKSSEARKKLNNGTDAKGNIKPATKEQIEEFYRGHPDYEDEYRRANRAVVVVGLIEDLKKAFEMKQRSLRDLHGVTFGHDQVQASDDRLSEMAAYDEAAAATMMAKSAGELEDIRKKQIQAPQAAKPKGKSPRRPSTKKGTKT